MTHILSPQQLRAARALLNWSRAQLAERTDVSELTIHRIENSLNKPGQRTQNKLRNILEQAGVEFTERGVALKDDQIVMLNGENVFFRLLDDVIATMQNTEKPEALFACVDDKKSPPVVIENYRRLRQSGIAMRSLIKQGDTYLIGKVKEYRYLPEQHFHNNTTVIYGDNFATMILDPTTAADLAAVIIRNPHIAAAQRNLFNLIWTNSPKPGKSTAKIHYEG